MIRNSFDNYPIVSLTSALTTSPTAPTTQQPMQIINMSTEKMSGRGKDMVPLDDNFTPGPNHVICAKGKQVKEHPANRFLKSLVKAHLKEYSECPSKLERSFIVSKILRTIQQDGKGGFVRNLNGKWYDIGPRNSKEKIGQSFRDSLHTKYRSSTKAKAHFRKRLQMSDESQSSSQTDSRRPSATSSNLEKLTSPSPSTKDFPISEVCFDRSAPQPDLARSETDVDWRDLEPLPLSQAMTFPSDVDVSSSTASSAANSRESAMTEARSRLSCTVLSSTTAPSMDTSRFGTFLQQQSASTHNRTAESFKQQTLLSSLQQRAMNAMMMNIPDPDPIRETPTPAGPVPSSMAFANTSFASDTTNTAPLASPAIQEQFLNASLQAPSVFPNSNFSAASMANSNPNAATFPTSLQQQQQQLPFFQQQLHQQQQQQLQMQQQQQSMGMGNATNSNAEEEFVQAFLKAQAQQQGQWKRQFE